MDDFQDALLGLARFGIAQRFAYATTTRSASDLGDIATAVLDAVEESPMPKAEWGPLGDLLSEDPAALVGVSTSSVGRCRSGERATPDEVAARLHTLALIVSDLSGSYNDFGIRRWFKRSRRALGGRARADIFHGDWDPESDDVIAVRDLASSLLGASIG